MRQVVRYQDSVTSFQKLTSGAPYGTKKGPLCFLLLNNESLINTVDDCLLPSSPWVHITSKCSTQQQQLKNVHKSACKVILGPAYTNYEDVLNILSLLKLSTRHRETLEKLGRGLLRHPRLSHLLRPDAP
ncbi:hypothetical protein E2C01_090948 [Portunus trituberculatus]|uniref:Uncharacterized protein n=1 Tax=Portunus trituberculatus TaxID=210409 RepID=A0A5B7JTS4_PORTR|nr:hypothetical protein [Portunus trituberculatus]